MAEVIVAAVIGGLLTLVAAVVGGVLSTADSPDEAWSWLKDALKRSFRRSPSAAEQRQRALIEEWASAERRAKMPLSRLTGEEADAVRNAVLLLLQAQVRGTFWREFLLSGLYSLGFFVLGVFATLLIG